MHDNPSFESFRTAMARRAFLRSSGVGVGAAALSLLESRAFGEAAATAPAAKPGRVHPPLPGLPHHAPKAKHVIYIHTNGGPSQIDLWDYKPKLVDYFDKDIPASIRGEQRLTTMTSGQSRLPVAPSKFTFEQVGGCGRWICTELLPHTAKVVDKISLVKTVHTNAINHDPANTFVMTGDITP
jgi:hypothetical protein